MSVRGFDAMLSLALFTSSKRWTVVTTLMSVAPDFALLAACCLHHRSRRWIAEEGRREDRERGGFRFGNELSSSAFTIVALLGSIYI
jgi:hypothetical protein